MGTWDKASITSFCAAKAAGPILLDRLVISRREGPRSWPQHATVSIETRPEAEWVGELIEHLEDLEASAHDSGAKSVEVELRLYRSTLPAGSRRFRIDLPQIVGAGLEDEDSLTPQQIFSASFSALVRANVELVAEGRKAFQSGNEIAIRALDITARMQSQIIESHQRASEATAALAIAEAQGSGGSGDLMKMADMIMPIVAMKMSQPT